MRYRPRDFANNGKQTATAELRQLETPNQATVVLNVRLDNGARLLKVQGILPATIKNLQLLMSTTPPSSPPLLAVEVAQKPAEKRSHEQMNEPAPTPEIQTIERPARPEILPRFSRSTSPLKPGQTPPKKSIRPESSPAGPTKNAAQQQQQGNIQVESSFARSSEDSVQLDSHPKHPIELFDWDKFEERFCNTMTELETREDKLYEEFTELTQFFEVWFSSLDLHESDRAYKRLKTRMHWVQGSERALEEKRGHYVRVVEAFKRALALLGDS